MDRTTPSPRPETIANMGTSRASLTRTVEHMTTRLSAHPDDGAAAVWLADSLVRVQRVNNDGRAAIAAEQHLRAFLARVPAHYAAAPNARHGAPLASIGSATRSRRRTRPASAIRGTRGITARWATAISSSATTTARLRRSTRWAGSSRGLRPTHASPMRLELQGDLPGALEYMHRAADGTTPNDQELQAWLFTQIGLLQLQQGKVGDAKQSFQRAELTFPGHPLAVDGIARIKIVEGEPGGGTAALPGTAGEDADTRCRRAGGRPDDGHRRLSIGRALLQDVGADRAGRVGQRRQAAASTWRDSWPSAIATFHARSRWRTRRHPPGMTSSRWIRRPGRISRPAGYRKRDRSPSRPCAPARVTHASSITPPKSRRPTGIATGRGRR